MSNAINFNEILERLATQALKYSLPKSHSNYSSIHERSVVGIYRGIWTRWA